MRFRSLGGQGVGELLVELDRQIKSGAVVRATTTTKPVSPTVARVHPAALVELKDAYNLEFLALPDDHSEADLHSALLRNLGRFITELGRDFCFVGSEYPVQVGNQDFAIDLVFFHRGLRCLVAFELKVEKFKPEHLGQLSFYVEALDRNVRKPHERPSIGVLLCANKDDEVVEYALARTTSPTLVAEYQTVLPSKEVLQAKLHELAPRPALLDRGENVELARLLRLGLPEDHEMKAPRQLSHQRCDFWVVAMVSQRVVRGKRAVQLS